MFWNTFLCPWLLSVGDVYIWLTLTVSRRAWVFSTKIPLCCDKLEQCVWEILFSCPRCGIWRRTWYVEQAPSKFHTDFCAIDHLLTLYSILIFVIADDIFWNTFVCASLRRTWVFQSPIFSTCSGMELAVRFVVFSIPSVRRKYGNHMRNFLYKWGWNGHVVLKENYDLDFWP